MNTDFLPRPVAALAPMLLASAPHAAPATTELVILSPVPKLHASGTCTADIIFNCALGVANPLCQLTKPHAGSTQALTAWLPSRSCCCNGPAARHPGAVRMALPTSGPQPLVR